MKVNDMNVTVSIVTHNSDKIFLSLDSLIRSLGKDQSIQIKIFDNASEVKYQERLANTLSIHLYRLSSLKKIKGLASDITRIS